MPCIIVDSECAGHMLDPEDLPGLAHFCEHMLFLGTKQVT